LFTRLWNIANIASLRSGYVKRAAEGFTSICFATSESRDIFHTKYKRLGPIISEASTVEFEKENNNTSSAKHQNNTVML
jgi:hypothetical protein